MMNIPDPKRGVVRALSLAAAAMLLLSAMPDQPAEALSLINPASAPAAKQVSDGLTTEVRGGHHGGGHGGRGAVFRGGGFRAAHFYRGGGYRHGGFRFAHRHHFRRHFYYAPSYSYYPHRYCRIVWTYYGPRKICRFRHHHHWRYHRRHHWRVYW
jgi:hypothetical protein